MKISDVTENGLQRTGPDLSHTAPSLRKAHSTLKMKVASTHGDRASYTLSLLASSTSAVGATSTRTQNPDTTRSSRGRTPYSSLDVRTAAQHQVRSVSKRFSAVLTEGNSVHLPSE